MKALEMSAGRRTFDILHHSQLVFSAEMSDQLAALPLTFSRKDGDTDAGGARLDGGTDGGMDSCVYRSVVFPSRSAMAAMTACGAPP